MIELKNVSKSFKEIKAVDDVTLNFGENSIYGLLGRNGAGKSTLLNMISNRIFPDNGEILVDGETAIENDKSQSKIFLMSEGNYYPETMKVSEAFKWSKEFYPDFDTEYAMSIAEDFGLRTNAKIKKLSTGYSSIFKIAVALSVGVPYVFFDEPVLGLDANHRDFFYKKLIARYEEKPCTYVISTHLIEEAAWLIENVVIIKNGKLILSDSNESLMARGYTVTGSSNAVDDYIYNKNVIGIDTLGGLKTAYLMEKLDKSSIPSGLEVSNLDLQKLFIKLTNS